jgi:hypothetical protein
MYQKCKIEKSKKEFRKADLEEEKRRKIMMILMVSANSHGNLNLKIQKIKENINLIR